MNVTITENPTLDDIEAVSYTHLAFMVAAQTFVKRAVCQRFAVVHCMAVATRDSFMLGNAVRIMGVAGIAFFVGKHDFGSGFYERLPRAEVARQADVVAHLGLLEALRHVVGRRLSFVHLGKRVLVVVAAAARHLGMKRGFAGGIRIRPLFDVVARRCV